jgi:hypothetical protein
MDQVGDLLQPFQERMPELFRVAEKFHDCGSRPTASTRPGSSSTRRTTSKPSCRCAGDENRRHRADGHPVGHGRAELHRQGQVRLPAAAQPGHHPGDHRRPDRADTGRRIDPYEWTDEYEDPQVFEALAEGWTLGVFQIETPLGTRVTRQLKPQNRRPT